MKVRQCCSLTSLKLLAETGFLQAKSVAQVLDKLFLCLKVSHSRCRRAEGQLKKPYLAFLKI